jgi:hypothetical protein
MKYRVHIHREMRLVFDGIEADTAQAAADTAQRNSGSWGI